MTAMVLHSKFGYTSVTYANPDGDPYYTQPCIKDPKTLLMSGGGAAFYTPESLANNEKGTTYGGTLSCFCFSLWIACSSYRF